MLHEARRLARAIMQSARTSGLSGFHMAQSASRGEPCVRHCCGTGRGLATQTPSLATVPKSSARTPRTRPRMAPAALHAGGASCGPSARAEACSCKRCSTLAMCCTSTRVSRPPSAVERVQAAALGPSQEHAAPAHSADQYSGRLTRAAVDGRSQSETACLACRPQLSRAAAEKPLAAAAAAPLVRERFSRQALALKGALAGQSRAAKSSSPPSHRGYKAPAWACCVEGAARMLNSAGCGGASSGTACGMRVHTAALCQCLRGCKGTNPPAS